MLTFVLDPVLVPRAFIGLVVRSCVEGKDRRGDHLRLVNKPRVKSKASGLEPARQEPAERDAQGNLCFQITRQRYRLVLPTCGDLWFLSGLTAVCTYQTRHFWPYVICDRTQVHWHLSASINRYCFRP